MREYKAISLKINADNIEGRIVPGLAAIIGNVDSGLDRIMPGAFTKTLQERKSRIKHLWQHEMWDPPTAVIKDIKEVGADELPDIVLEKFPDALGALQVDREYLKTDRGEETFQGVIMGAITAMSFAYDVMESSFVTPDEGDHKDITIRRLHELRLWETSDVNWGMNEATVASKSSQDLMIDHLKKLVAGGLEKGSPAYAKALELLQELEATESNPVNPIATDGLKLQIDIRERLLNL